MTVKQLKQAINTQMLKETSEALEPDFYEWVARAWGLSKDEIDADKTRLASLQKLFQQKKLLNKSLGRSYVDADGNQVEHAGNAAISKTIDTLVPSQTKKPKPQEDGKENLFGVHSHADVGKQIFDIDPTDKKAVNTKRVQAQNLERDLATRDEGGEWKGKFVTRARSFLSDPTFMQRFMKTVERSAFEFVELMEEHLQEKGGVVNMAMVYDFYTKLIGIGVVEAQALTKLMNREIPVMRRLFDLVADQTGNQLAPEDFLIHDIEEGLVIPEHLVEKLIERSPPQIERMMKEQFGSDPETESLVKELVSMIQIFQSAVQSEEKTGGTANSDNLMTLLKAELASAGLSDEEQDQEIEGHESRKKPGSALSSDLQEMLGHIVDFVKDNFVSGENVLLSFQNYVSKNFNPSATKT